MQIQCNKSNGYKWTVRDNIYFKGYVQLENGEVLRDVDACKYFSALKSKDDLKTALTNIDGIFAVIIDMGDTVWAATDAYRSFPLYYSVDNMYLSDSSETVRNAGNYNEPSLEELFELYATGIVSFADTAIKQIKQIQQGCICEFKGGAATIAPYFSAFQETSQCDYQGAMDKFSEVTKRNFEKIKKIAEGRTLALSLSGGYDSRYMAIQLKEAGVEDVVCFSYGREGSFEVEVARKIADTLGFKFIPIECTKEKILRAIDETDMFRYCYSHDYAIYLQNYIAIKELSEKKLIPSNSIIVTGIINDAPVGFYVPQDDVIHKYNLTNSGVANYLVDVRFAMTGISDEKRMYYVNKIEQVLKMRNICVADEDSFVHAMNCIMIENEHLRMYYRMNDIHEFFGFEYLFPFITKEMLQFWFGLPRELLISRGLYSDYINEVIGKKYGLSLGRKSNVVSNNEYIAKIKRKVGGMLVKMLYTRGVHFNRSTDINALSYLEPVIAKKIKQKNAIISEYANLGHLMNVYLMEGKYGVNWYGRVAAFKTR